MPKHHYNANFNIRRFTDANGTLWVLDKDSGRSWSKTGGGQDRYDVFAEKSYNTVIDARGNHDDSVERYYTEVEANAAPVIDMIIELARAGLVAPLNPVKHENVCRFLWAQYVRSPFERLATMKDDTAQRAMDEAVLDTCVKFGISPQIIAAFLPKDLREMMDNAIVKAPTAPEEPDNAVAHMKRMVVDVLKVLPAADADFITSDRSCLVEPILRPGGSVLMPVAKDVAVQLSRPENSSGNLVSVGRARVDGINERIYHTALRYVAGPRPDHLSNLFRESTARRSRP